MSVNSEEYRKHMMDLQYRMMDLHHSRGDKKYPRFIIILSLWVKEYNRKNGVG